MKTQPKNAYMEGLKPKPFDYTTRPPEQAVPVDWQALAISRYERIQELLPERDRLRDDLNATIQRDNAEILMLTAQRDELLAAAKEARMALTLDYHGTTRPKKALCDVSAAASQAHNQIVLAIAKCEANK